MVYETDFYTIRRPYSRPTITSYSVTGCRPFVWKTTEISPVGAHSKLRLSVLLNELNRIQNRPRMHLGYVPTEDFLNSRPLVEFDDETKYIRAEADRLMRYLYVPIPHHSTKQPLTTSYDRISNGLNPYSRSGISNDILNMSYYYEPTRTTIGRGHLACVTFAGGRGYPRRKHLFTDEYRDIGDEIKVRSYYNKNLTHQNRLDDALSLPTGFAARLLTTERKPYAEGDKKSNITKYKRNDTKTPGEILFTQKREKLEQNDTTDKELLKNFKDLPKKDEEIKESKKDIQEKETKSYSSKIQDIPVDKIEKPAKVEPLQSEEKPKSKKDSRRRLSEKSSEETIDIKSVNEEKPKKLLEESKATEISSKPLVDETKPLDETLVKTETKSETTKKLVKSKSKELPDQKEETKDLSKPVVDETKSVDETTVKTEPKSETTKKLVKSKSKDLPEKEESKKSEIPVVEEVLPEKIPETEKLPEKLDETSKVEEEIKPVEPETVQETIIEPEKSTEMTENVAEFDEKEIITEQKVEEEQEISENIETESIKKTEIEELQASKEIEEVKPTETSSDVQEITSSEVTTTDKDSAFGQEEFKSKAIHKENEITEEITAIVDTAVNKDSEITGDVELHTEATTNETTHKETVITKTEFTGSDITTALKETTVIKSTEITTNTDEPVIFTESTRKETTVIKTTTEITGTDLPNVTRKETVITTEITENNEDPITITEVTDHSEPIIEEPVTPEANISEQII